MGKRKRIRGSIVPCKKPKNETFEIEFEEDYPKGVPTCVHGHRFKMSNFDCQSWNPISFLVYTDDFFIGIIYIHPLLINFNTRILKKVLTLRVMHFFRGGFSGLRSFIGTYYG